MVCIDYSYHFVYKTTNLINNKIYIGVHSTNDLEDGYLGSGIAFERALKKYGMDNFIREVLGFYDTREEAEAYEEFLVNDSFVKRSDNYNLVKGGKARGGWDIWTSPKAEAAREKLSKRGKGYKNPDFEKRWGPIYEEVASTACHYFCNTNLPDYSIGRLIKSRFNHSLKAPRLLKYYSYCNYLEILDKVEWKDFFGRGYVSNQTFVKTLCRSLTNTSCDFFYYKSLKTSYLDAFYELLGFLNDLDISDSMLINGSVGASFKKGVYSRIKYFEYLGFLKEENKIKIKVNSSCNGFNRLQPAIKTLYKTVPVHNLLTIDVDGGYNEYRIDFNGSTFQKTRI